MMESLLKYFKSSVVMVFEIMVAPLFFSHFAKRNKYVYALASFPLHVFFIEIYIKYRYGY